MAVDRYGTSARPATGWPGIVSGFLTACWIAFPCLAHSGLLSEEPGIQRQGGAGGYLEWRGLSPAVVESLAAAGLSQEQWHGLFGVWAGQTQDGLEDRQPLLGSYEAVGGLVRFRPSFPFRPGVEITARLHLERLGRQLGLAPPAGEPVLLRQDLGLPARHPGPPATRVSGVFPSAPEVPENLLKLYVQFSDSMGLGQAYEHVRLVDGAGQELEGAILEIEQELWDPERRRLTLLLDPGRIKRGLRPNREAGAPLASGGLYRLQVAAGYRDAAGRPLVEGFMQSFRAGPADRRQPDVVAWRLTLPAIDSRDPLRVVFGEPLDRALLEDALRVLHPSGEPLAGRGEIAAGETGWIFWPAEPWASGTYHLEAAAYLEDLAGNSLAAPFDLDLEDPASRRRDEQVIRRAFDLGSF